MNFYKICETALKFSGYKYIAGISKVDGGYIFGCINTVDDIDAIDNCPIFISDDANDIYEYSPLYDDKSFIYEIVVPEEFKH